MHRARFKITKQKRTKGNNIKTHYLLSNHKASMSVRWCTLFTLWYIMTTFAWSKGGTKVHYNIILIIIQKQNIILNKEIHNIYLYFLIQKIKQIIQSLKIYPIVFYIYNSYTTIWCQESSIQKYWQMTNQLCRLSNTLIWIIQKMQTV